MSPKIKSQFADDYSANFEFADQIDSMIRQVADALNPEAVGTWIAALGCRELKYEDWDHQPPLRLILHFTVEEGRPVLGSLLGPNNWPLLKWPVG